MGSLGGILTGALALAALETVVSSSQATSGVASLAQVPGKWAATFLDPAKPLVPNFVNAPCANGDLSLSDALTAAYQGPAGGVPVVQPASLPDASTLPPPAAYVPASSTGGRSGGGSVDTFTPAPPNVISA